MKPEATTILLKHFTIHVHKDAHSCKLPRNLRCIQPEPFEKRSRALCRQGVGKKGFMEIKHWHCVHQVLDLGCGLNGCGQDAPLDATLVQSVPTSHWGRRQDAIEFRNLSTLNCSIEENDSRVSMKKGGAHVPTLTSALRLANSDGKHSNLQSR